MKIFAGTYERFYTIGEFDDHAGVVETALLMHYRPDLVDLSLIGKPLAVPSSVAGGNDDFDAYCAPKGFGSGILPTPEIGMSIAKNIVENIGKEKSLILGAYQEKPGYKPPSMLDTEDIWHRFLKLAGRYLTITATRREAENGIFPIFPGWDELGE